MPVAERMYAGALYEAARDADRVEPVRRDLADFAATVEEVPQLRELLRNPQLDPRAKVSALAAVLADVDELVRNFVLLVAERGRGAQLGDIQREFERLVAAETGQLDVELTTAFELSEDEAREIVDQIRRASGRRVNATTKVDPSLLGGIVLQAGSLRVDATVRGRLNRLRRELVNAPTT